MRILTTLFFSIILASLGCSDSEEPPGVDPDAGSETGSEMGSDMGSEMGSDANLNAGFDTGSDADIDSDATVGPGDDAGSDSGEPATWNVLLFSRTEGFRHGSIPDALAAIRNYAEAEGHTVTATEETDIFTDEGLAPFDVVVFVMTTGDILDTAEEAAFENWVGQGGGWAGIHSASDTEYDWAWYGGLVGAFFDNHPSIQEAELTVENDAHLSTAHLPATWTRRDEWYNFRENPRSEVTVLLTIDESTYDGGSMGDDHPMAWCHDYAGGRSWYTAGGHTNESYADDDFMRHVMGGLAYAAGEGSCP